MTRDPRGIAAWFGAGLIVGCLAASGALVGGVVFGSQLPGNSASWIGSIVVACVGSLGLFVAARAVAPRHRFGL